MVSLLIVDDEPAVVQSLQLQLTSLASEGVWIEGALNAHEALELLPHLSAPLAVVIADYLMPGMRGDDLLIEIHKRVPTAKLLLLTGQAEAHNVGKIVNAAPLYRYMAKPWDPLDLQMTIREALRAYHLESAYQHLTDHLEARINAQNELLLQAQATSEAWVQRVSHDLRGPLSGMKQLAYLLQEEGLPKERVQKYADLLARALSELEGYVYNLLDLVRMRQRHLVLHKQLFAWRELAHSLQAMIEAQAAAKGVRVELSTPEETGWGDPIYLRQALLNLLSNAIKFTPSGRAVRLRIESTAAEDVIWVIDEGIGMKADELSRLWEPQKAYLGVGTAGERGMGLGLPMVKSIIEGHGGQISVQSQPAVGTRFQIRLPRKP
jgi:signal transduction histidine kinase